MSAASTTIRVKPRLFSCADVPECSALDDEVDLTHLLVGEVSHHLDLVVVEDRSPEEVGVRTKFDRRLVGVPNPREVREDQDFSSESGKIV
jgi:hypothetical protein